ncbi:lytic transglycosylase domain-containing protein [uncultured Sphingomonas sp.]|uniref:lytic murein transglycosylase n=1 Tax=uncultured Sphingomonas sp. TaxID=158754 RepID=UPI0025D22C99|nr:lytic murein transglycosylase [uncultured Sphingomonas sp.]
MIRRCLPFVALLHLTASAMAQQPAAVPVPVLAQQPVVAPAPAPSAQDATFTAFIAGLRDGAIREGVKPATFDRETAGLTFNPRVVSFDRGQPGGSPSGPPGVMDFAPYRRSHVDQAHVTKGRALYQGLSAMLAGNEARTGVSARVALSIFGLETGYGSFTGNFDLIRSLASLAYEGRRRELFTAELIATIKLIDLGFTRDMLKGSWAGATGYPQFLPSVYLRIGTDGDGDGKADIWRSRADALASIAAYLQEAGWKPRTPWGVQVMVPGTLDRASLRSPLASPRCPRVHARYSRWLTIAEWKAKGILFAGAAQLPDTELASLIEPDGPGNPAYLLTTNYRSILDYNCSNFYALSVGVLADEVTR